MLALDLAGTVGWAYGSGDGRIELGTVILAPGKDRPLGAILDYFRRWLGERLATLKPARIVYESPFLSRQTRSATARRLMSLCGMAEAAAWEWQIPICEATTWESTKFITGHARFITGEGKAADRIAKKEAVLIGCRALGYDPANYDEADACALWLYTEKKFADAALS